MNPKFNRMHETTLRSVLKNLFGETGIMNEAEFPTPWSVLDWAAAMGLLNLPAGVNGDHASWLPERLPLLADLSQPRRSLLVRVLMDRLNETVLVADILTKSYRSYYLAGLYQDPGEITGWIQAMDPRRVELFTKPVDETYGVLLAPLSAFVRVQLDPSENEAS